MDLRGVLRQSDGERRRETSARATAQAVAAARKSMVVLILVVWRGFPAVVGVLFRDRREVSTSQMQRGTGVPADESERQQQD
jgi:hypothetical protein